MSLVQLQSIQFSPGTTALDYSDEFNVLGITGDKYLWLLNDPLNSTDKGNSLILSQHGHPSLVRFILVALLNLVFFWVICVDL